MKRLIILLSILALALTACSSAPAEKDYTEVKTALDGKTWYFNGGNEVTINSITFTADSAEIAQAYFDGNGYHDAGVYSYSYKLDDANIILAVSENSETTIPYTFADGEVTLPSGEYFTIDEIEEGLQGYWTWSESGYSYILQANSASEYNMYLNNGNAIYENASLAYGGSNGEYYYYGPYEGPYTLSLGKITCDASHGNEWFYNIIDGKVAVLHYDNVFKPSSGLPGENGYKF